MTLFVSVVNHNHDEMICHNSTLKELAKEHYVILKSNTPASDKLNKYCKENAITLIQGTQCKGFAANNNEVFEHAEKELKMKEGDYFLVLNPDVEIDNKTVNRLLKQVFIDKSSISTINLFKNKEMTIHDYSIRHFPSIFNPVKTILGIKRKDYYDKDKIKSPITIDWTAGSFMLFKYLTYRKLNGFDEKFFMYFEDVDICKRAQLNKDAIIYYPQYKAIHNAQFSNRKIFSKESFYYLNSTLKYFIKTKI